MTPQEYAALPWLHMYGQYAWHDEVKILGTRAALEALRDAISSVLETGQPASSEAIVADGEGYHVEIEIASKVALDGMPLPYSADYAKG